MCYLCIYDIECTRNVFRSIDYGYSVSGSPSDNVPHNSYLASFDANHSKTATERRSKPRDTNKRKLRYWTKIQFDLAPTSGFASTCSTCCSSFLLFACV